MARSTMISWIVSALLIFSPFVQATRQLSSISLVTCQKNSQFSASQFNITFAPDENSLYAWLQGASTIDVNFTVDMFVKAYGLQVFKVHFDPCAGSGPVGLCGMQPGPFTLPRAQFQIDPAAVSKIPGIAYTIPDIDLSVTIYFNASTTGQPIACVQTTLSNGKTVYLPAVCWVIAVITGLGLIAAALASGLGHPNTAAHVAANTLSLFGFFQAQAFIGLTAANLPPIVDSWTQDFQWSMGIIRVGFLQKLATWYQRSTGGTASTLLSTLSFKMVEVQRRSLEYIAQRNVPLLKRVVAASSDSIVVVRGIERVGFRANIEPTNIFMTGYSFFIIFVMFVVIFILLARAICLVLERSGKFENNSEKFSDLRNDWTVVMKGILFRVVLIGFPQMILLCSWQLVTAHDSTAEMFLAAATLVSFLVVLGISVYFVFRLARQATKAGKSLTEGLFGTSVAVNKWAFLYNSYHGSRYWWVAVALVYILVKSLIVGCGQGNNPAGTKTPGQAQAIGFLILELGYLVILCMIRPYMDKKTNAFNIAIQVINFINAIFLLFFSGLFNIPAIVPSAMGLVFFFLNAIFAFILLILLLVASAFAIFSRNPDVRYQPMQDDRGSFIRSQTNLANNKELEALGQTARGENRHGYSNSRIIDGVDPTRSGDTTQLLGAHTGGESPVPPYSSRGYQDELYGGGEKPPFYQQNARGSNASGFSPSPFRGATPSNNGRASPTTWQKGAGFD